MRPRERARDADLARRLGPRRALLRRIGRVAHAAGGRAYLVGGAVRDLLGGRRLHDLDVVVEGDLAGLLRRLAPATRDRPQLNPRFHTATLRLRDGGRIDLARARGESYARPAALPRVHPADLRTDLLRRDFTVNAMALALVPGRFGALCDPAGGRRDLRARRLRVLHPRSFFDDPTRALRGIRFVVRLGFHVERETRRLLREAIRGGAFDALSAQRLRREWAAMFAAGRWPDVAREIGRLGLWPTLHPRLRPAPADGARLGRLEHAASSRDAAEAEPWIVALALLGRRLDAAARRSLAARLACSARETRVLLEAAEDAERILAALRRGTLSPGRVWAACRGRSLAGVRLAAAIARDERRRLCLGRHIATGRLARSDVSGDDLLEAGVPAGRAVARGLAAATRAKLDGTARSRAEQLAVALAAARRA